MTDHDHHIHPRDIAAVDQGLARHRDHIRKLTDQIRAHRAAGNPDRTVIGIPNRITAWLATTPPIQLVGLVLALLDERARRPEPRPDRHTITAAAAVLDTCYAADPAAHRAAAQALAAAGLLTTAEQP